MHGMRCLKTTDSRFYFHICVPAYNIQCCIDSRPQYESLGNGRACRDMNYYIVSNLRGGADKSLDRPTSRCRRTESVVSLERGVCSCAELQVFSCYRGWKEACQARRAISTTSRRELSSGFIFLVRQGAEGNLRHSDRNITTCSLDWRQLKGRHFSSNAEVIAAAETWLDGQPYELFLSGLQKLEQRAKKCIELRGEYVE